MLKVYKICPVMVSFIVAMRASAKAAELEHLMAACLAAVIVVLMVFSIAARMDYWLSVVFLQ